MDQEVKIIIKYLPTTLPPNKNPSFDVFSIDINKKYINEILGKDLITSLVKAIRDGEDKSAFKVAENYQDLQKDLGAMLQGVQGYRLSKSDTITRHIFIGGKYRRGHQVAG